jgi:hypothetical protein
MGPPLFDGGTEADSGPDGNRTIFDRAKIRIFPLSFWIDFFLANLIVYWTLYA